MMQFAHNDATLILKIEQTQIANSFYTMNSPYSKMTRNKTATKCHFFKSFGKLID